MLSVLIAGASLALIFLYWYPSPFAKIMGIGTLAWMMLGIDVVLGPLLTLLVAKKDKKTLKFDLAVIGAVQMLALGYGLYSIERAHPVAVVFDVNRFEVVSKYAIQDKNAFISWQPAVARMVVASVRPAKTPDEMSQRMQLELDSGVSMSAHTDLYEPVEKNFAMILANAKPIAQLAQFNKQSHVDNVKKSYASADFFMPLVGNNGTATVLLDSKQQAVVGFVPLRPW